MCLLPAFSQKIASTICPTELIAQDCRIYNCYLKYFSQKHRLRVRAIEIPSQKNIRIKCDPKVQSFKKICDLIVENCTKRESFRTDSYSLD